jgi:hypothetical protein
MTRPALSVLTLAAAVAVGGAAAPVPKPAGENAPPALEQLRRQDARVGAMAWRLARAGLGLCADTGPVAGWTLHDLAQYGPNRRAEAKAWFGLDAAAPSVLAVAPGGPAERAGLRPDDVLEAVNGRSLAGGAPAPAESRAPGTYAGMERALGALDAALRAGPARLSVRRGDARLALTLTPETACAYEVQLIPSSRLNASADGRRVFVTTALVDYAAADDDLAVVLGHEYAHDVLRHAARGRASLFGARPGAVRAAEREADYVGLYLAARAGYAVDGAAGFWRRFAADYGAGASLSLSHPGARERAAIMEAAVREIAAKRARGEPLEPAAAGLPNLGAKSGGSL